MSKTTSSSKVNASGIIKLMMDMNIKSLSSVRFLFALEELGVASSSKLSEHLDYCRVSIAARLAPLVGKKFLRVFKGYEDGKKVNVYALTEMGEEFIDHFRDLYVYSHEFKKNEK